MRLRDEIMSQWDGIRRMIASGCTNSGPRDWFEGVLDEQGARIAKLEARLKRAVVDDKAGFYCGMGWALGQCPCRECENHCDDLALLGLPLPERVQLDENGEPIMSPLGAEDQSPRMVRGQGG